MKWARQMMAVALFATAVTAATTTTESATAQNGPFYANDFESATPGDNVSDWVDTSAHNSSSVDDSLFEVAAVDGTQAWSTTSKATNIHSHYLGSGAAELSSYSYSGRMRADHGVGGVGVTFLSDYPSSDAYYRLRRYGSGGAFRLSPHGTSITGGDVDSGVVPEPGAWYRFRIEVVGGADTTGIRANVWPDGAAEPSGWQIDAVDDSGTRRTTGTFGVWSHRTGAKYWDDLRVEVLEQDEPSPATLSVDANGPGTVSVDPELAEYEEGQEVTLTAVPDDGAEFVEWSGDGSGSANPMAMTVSGDLAVAAEFRTSDVPPTTTDQVPPTTTDVPPTTTEDTVPPTTDVPPTTTDDTVPPTTDVPPTTTDDTAPPTTEDTPTTTDEAPSPTTVADEPLSGHDEFVSDDFNACSLDDDVWSFVDPVGDGGISVNGTQLELSVPSGTTHDVWTGGNMAPRVMQPVGDGGLGVEVAFESVVSDSYEMQGLIIEEDAGDFIRAEVHGRNGQAVVFVARFTGGQPTTVGQVWLGALSSDDPRVGLRVTRDGDTWTVSSSVADAPWSDAVSFVHEMSVSEAGVFAGNAGAAPAHTAVVDYAFDTAAPIDPEDGDDPSCETPPTTTTPPTTDATPPTTDATPPTTDATPPTTDATPPTTDATPPTTDVTPPTTTVPDEPSEGAPTIDVWYGDQQEYGQIGVPQPYYNVFGNVSDPDGVASLSYSLNGGASAPLSIGPNRRRLSEPGDFNIDVPQQDLDAGENEVAITAVDGLGNSRTETITVDYADNLWPGEYQVDWSEAGSIGDVAQVVDGKWEITDDGLRIAEPGYDRLVALGDTSWTDYEIEVPVTLHSIDPRGFESSQSGGAGLGFLMRWNGHTDQPVAGAQPKTGWLPYGAIGWYRWNKPDQHRLRLDGNWGSLLDASNAMQVTPGNTYIYKMRVETTPGSGGRYSLKLWEAGTAEPGQWTVTGQESLDDPQNGSVLLLAHHVDATFGDVEITPLADFNAFELDVTTTGSGTVGADPAQETYAYGDEVSLTATPDPGYVFAGWSGDISGSANPTTVTMNGSRQVTATFVPEDQAPVISGVSVQTYLTSAVVTWSTDRPATSEVAYGETTDYELGTVSDATLRTEHSVTLSELSPETLHHYRVTSVGEGGGSASSSDRTFSTTVVDPTAFVSDDFNACELNDGVWSFVDPVGDSGMSLNGTQLELSVPGGTTHDVWTGGNMAPRVMQPVGDGELEIEVGFESVVSDSYEMQGLIVEQDAGNFIRAEIHGRSGQAYVFVARFTNGQPTTVAQVPLGALSSDDPQVGLRITRDGGSWTVSSSVAGDPWNDAVTFVHEMSVSEAGVFTGNAGSAPAHTAVVDYAFDIAAPIDPEDPDSPSCT